MFYTVKLSYDSSYTTLNGIIHHTQKHQVCLRICNTQECHYKIKDQMLYKMHSGLRYGSSSKTYHNLASHFYCTNMQNDGIIYGKTCPVCQVGKQSNQKLYSNLNSLPINKPPWSHISMDFLTLPEAT